MSINTYKQLKGLSVSAIRSRYQTTGWRVFEPRAQAPRNNNKIKKHKREKQKELNR